MHTAKENGKTGKNEESKRRTGTADGTRKKLEQYKEKKNARNKKDRLVYSALVLKLLLL